MTPTLVVFNDIFNSLYYINTNRIEYVMFIPIQNAINKERICCRCGEGLIDTTVYDSTATMLKKRLNQFVPTLIGE